LELDPKRLLVLHALADGGGLAAAARALGHTRSAVSQQLARLERQVGLPLVDRTGSRLELTADGRLLAASGERIHRELAAAARRLSVAGGRVAGPVSIGASSWVIVRIAIPTLRLLADRYPDIEPRIVETGLRDGLRQLRLGELDVLIVSDDRETAVPLPPSVKARVLVEDAYHLVVPDGWPAPDGAAGLSGRPWISAPVHSARGRAFARFAATHGIVPSAEHLAAHPSAVRTLLTAGLGAALLPAYFAARLTDARVTEVPVSGLFVSRLLYRTGPAGAAPAAEATVTALCEAGRNVAERDAADGVPREAVIRPLRDPGGDGRTAEPVAEGGQRVADG
jgi:DNA-binding transcriptional LysR family regulator